MEHLNIDIKCFFAKFQKTEIIKVFTLTGLSTLIKMLTGLVSVKFIAILIGPSGIALVGQLNNFIAIALSVASGGINNGITKYIAEYKSSEEKIKLLLSTALKITLICSIICGLLIIIFNKILSYSVMMSEDYGYVFIIFGITIFLYALNMMIVSILNGYKEFSKFVIVNIFGSIIGLAFTISLVITLGITGALISMVTFQSIMLFITLWIVRKLPWMSFEYFKNKIDKDTLNKYIRYSIMTIISAATVPVAQLILRTYVISNVSSTEAGWWEAMNRISNMYLMVITSSFSVYYLPRLSELKKKNEIRQEIIKAYKIIIPMLVGGFTIIYLLRFTVINILFTKEFAPMENLFIWQLMGDFFKITSWLLAFLMVAKSMTKLFVITEITFSFIYVVLGLFFISRNGLVGVTQAYMANYVIYFITMFYIFRRIILK